MPVDHAYSRPHIFEDGLQWPLKGLSMSPSPCWFALVFPAATFDANTLETERRRTKESYCRSPTILGGVSYGRFAS
jgi:hypothetical protein